MVKKDGTQLFFYARYADDMLFGIPKGSAKRRRERKRFIQAVRNLRFSYTVVDLARETSPKFRQGQGIRLAILFD